jgi:prolyl oligopeptidase
MLTRCPELFDAVMIQVPLLDMRYRHELLAGAPWVTEYGDPPEPGQWEYIKPFSRTIMWRPGSRTRRC